MDEKQIAKEILITMIENSAILRSEYPNAETSVDVICEAYKKILSTVKEG